MQFSMNMLFKRQHGPLLEATEKASRASIERVLWIDPSYTYIVTIDSDIQHRNAWPVKCQIADLERDLRSGIITHVEKDPYHYIYQSDEAFPPEYLEKRKESWELVNPTCKFFKPPADPIGAEEPHLANETTHTWYA